MARRGADGKPYLTEQGKEVMRLLKRNPRAGVEKIKSLKLKLPKTKKGSKAKAKKGTAAKKKKKGGKGGKAKPKEDEKEKDKTEGGQLSNADRMAEMGLDPDVSDALTLMLDADNPSQAANQQNPEIQAALLELGMIEERDGAYIITEDARMVQSALENGDWETVIEILGLEPPEEAEAPEDKDDSGGAGGGEADEMSLLDVITEYAMLIDEDFAQRLKQGGPKWERATNAYELALRDTYQRWADDAADELADVEDEPTFRERLHELVDELILALILLGRRNLPDAMALGRGDVPPTPDGIRELAEMVGDNDRYLRDSLRPDIVNKVERRVREDDMLRKDKASLAAVFGTFLARVGSYAGWFWALIHLGLADKIRQMLKKPRVRSVLDPRASHCRQCPEYAGVYDSIDDLIAKAGGVPGKWDSDCDGNCRCHLEFERDGKWVRA
jgi:hypothetical protein